jgi:hypothetical protein
MIDSRYWKEELTRIAKTLRRVRNGIRWSERTHCVVERDLMIGFFLVRRLVELHKVSTKTRNHSMTVFSCRLRGKQRRRIDDHDIWELYELENERRESKGPLYLANQFIHAYTSFVRQDESRNWSDAYVVSDYDRNNCIWRIPVADIRNLFLVAAQDYPHTVNMIYNNENGDYDVSTN